MCRYLSNKIGFILFGVRVLKLSQFSFRVPQVVVPLTQAVVPLEVQKKQQAVVPGRYRSGTGSHAVCPAVPERYRGGSTA